MENKELIKDFEFKKKFGQNFIFDTNLLNAICRDAELTKDSEVLEIGMGAGTLTKSISSFSKKVVGYEIDESLKEILLENLKECKNVEIVFKDIMKEDDKIIAGKFNNEFSIVANLPYYITTPIIFKFIEGNFNLKSITIMLQKEVAQRICAKPKTKDYGVLSVNLQAISNCSIKRIINRNMFMPAPNVDSAIIHIEIDKNKYKISNLKKFSMFVEKCFAMRRKTLANNLKQGFSLNQNQIDELFEQMNISSSVRAEELEIAQFVELFNNINTLKNKS